MREQPALTLAFACYHLALGASAIHVFLDNPNDLAITLLRRLPNTYVTCCDDTFWRDTHGIKRPELNTRRQSLNATRVLDHARKRGNMEALLHLDADEFLYLPEPLSREWGRLSHGHKWLSIPNVERVWLTPPEAGTIFDGQFRVPLFGRPGHSKTIYGKFEQFLAGGLAGHGAGKALAEPGEGAFLAIHKVKDGGPTGATLDHKVAKTARILHFNGMTPQGWILKTLRFLGKDQAELKRRLSAPMVRRVNWILAQDDPARAALYLHRKLFHLSPGQARALTSVGGLVRARIDPFGDMDAYLGQDAPSIALTDYDAGMNRVYAPIGV